MRKTNISTFNIGKYVENYFSDILTSFSIKNSIIEGKYIFYDIEAHHIDLQFTCEVKADMMSLKTNNVAIEFWNSKQCKPSGISATKADIWVHCIPDKKRFNCYIISSNKLREFINNHEPKKIVLYGGDNNASILLYDIDIFTQYTYLLDEENDKIKFIDFIKGIKNEQHVELTRLPINSDKNNTKICKKS